MTNSAIQAWLDQEDTHIAQTIRKHGQFIQLVMGDPDQQLPSFAYTVGLFGLGHPELVVLSVDGETACGLLNHLGDRIRAGENLVSGTLLSFEEWPRRVVVQDLPNAGEIVFSANRHYQRPAEASVPAYQLTYDDLQGRFPWETGYCNETYLQPPPGTWRA
jgi:Domain of unknown function (DUF4262)